MTMTLIALLTLNLTNDYSTHVNYPNTIVKTSSTSPSHCQLKYSQTPLNCHSSSHNRRKLIDYLKKACLKSSMSLTSQKAYVSSTQGLLTRLRILVWIKLLRSHVSWSRCTIILRRTSCLHNPLPFNVPVNVCSSQSPSYYMTTMSIYTYATSPKHTCSQQQP